MRLSELIAQLEDLRDMYPDLDPEVFLAQQPNWPFKYSVGQLVIVDANAEDRELWDNSTPEEREGQEEPQPDIEVYIGEGSQLAYLSGEASRELDWR